jgi:hypothetical protein
VKEKWSRIVKYDLCLAYDSEYEVDFINMIMDVAQKRQLSTFTVTPQNLSHTIEKLKNHEIEFGFYYDRASDTSPLFLPLYNLISEFKIPIFDHLEDMKWASNKATMHLEFISQNLYTPYTIILPPFASNPVVNCADNEFSHLGRPFIIKPATISGGGIGVIHQARTEDDIKEARRQYPNDFYLLQEKVYPLQRDGRRFWFRGFYCCGLSLCTWWNDVTHLYNLLTDDQVEKYGLWPLFSIIEKIAHICRLHFFSTEIVLNADNKFIIVDYVNEVCDMRVQSLHADGVPDELARSAAFRIVTYISQQIDNLKANYSMS